jgi:hypothetical protein
MALDIIDEGSMINKLCYEALDKTMRDLVPEKDNKKTVKLNS